MLKNFSVSNYKNFKEEISVDFGKIAGYHFNEECITNNLIGKMIIYGKNATGKTNLGRAMMDIWVRLLGDTDLFHNDIFLNADSTADVVKFSYTFQFDDVQIVYQYVMKSYEDLTIEKLYYNDELTFECNFENNEYIFNDLSILGAESANTQRYEQYLLERKQTQENILRLPFLRWVMNNVALQIDSVLIKLFNYVRRMTFFSAGSSTLFGFFRRRSNNLLELLDHPGQLTEFEEFLNDMGIECRLVLKKLPDGQKELYFKHDRLVPFYANASSGTLALAELYLRFISKIKEASFVYLDEFDAFYHYEMAEEVINFFKSKCRNCQVVMTSHNTNLMDNSLMRPDCLFILSRRGRLTALCDATERELREGHNLEKMYIGGEFDAYE